MTEVVTGIFVARCDPCIIEMKCVGVANMTPKGWSKHVPVHEEMRGGGTFGGMTQVAFQPVVFFNPRCTSSDSSENLPFTCQG